MNHPLSVNKDKVAGAAASGATPVEFNITKLAKEGRHTLKVQQTECEQNSVNALVRAGVKPQISDIQVICQPAIYVRDILCSTTINNRGEGVAEFGLVIKCGTLNPKRARIGYILNLNDTTVLSRGYKDVALDMRREDTIRFMAIVPQNSLWSIKNPHSLTLDIESRIDNRPVECISQKVGVRAADVADSKFYLNYQPLDLKLKNYEPSQPVTEQVTAENNGLVIPVYYATEQLLEQCDKAGILVFILSDVNTLTLAESIRRKFCNGIGVNLARVRVGDTGAAAETDIEHGTEHNSQHKSYCNDDGRCDKAGFKKLVKINNLIPHF